MATLPQPNTILSNMTLSMTGQLRSTLYRFTYDWATTQELLQEVHLRALAAKPIRDPNKVPAYIRSIAMNVGRDWWRRNKRSLVDCVYDIEELQYYEQANPPERHVIDQQIVEKLMNALTPRERQVVKYTKEDGYLYRETADLMDIAEGTVQAHLRNALLRLRRAKKKIDP